jgi:hypothetical protein
MYCLCVNVYCTAATGWQHNCSKQIHQYQYQYLETSWMRKPWPTGEGGAVTPNTDIQNYRTGIMLFHWSIKMHYTHSTWWQPGYNIKGTSQFLCRRSWIKIIWRLWKFRMSFNSMVLYTGGSKKTQKIVIISLRITDISQWTFIFGIGVWYYKDLQSSLISLRCCKQTWLSKSVS